MADDWCVLQRGAIVHFISFCDELRYKHGGDMKSCPISKLLRNNCVFFKVYGIFTILLI